MPHRQFNDDAPDMGPAWDQYAKMHAAQPDAHGDAAKRAFAHAYREGVKAGRRQMAAHASSQLTLQADQYRQLAQAPNEENA